MNITIWQTIVLALLQGVTELFPISSLGHTVLVPGLLGWGNMTTDTACGGDSCFVPLITALHLGTSIALLLYFWRDWLQVGRTLVVTAKDWKSVRKGTPEWVSWLIIVGTIPAGLLGVLLDHFLKRIFASPLLAAAFLVLNGAILFLGEAMRRSSAAKFSALPPREREKQFRHLDSLSFKEALAVGSAQALALIPGFSRSGMTIVGGLAVRLKHEDAARFSFLLGTPIILAAAALEVPKLLHLPASTLLMVLFGAVLSGIAAFVSTRFLLKYFETGRLDPFAYYCMGAGLIMLILFFTVLPGRA